MPKLPNPKPDYLAFAGGLDLVTPVYSTLAGTLRDAQNWEIGINSGYETTKGYEVFDGGDKPSDEDYYTWDVQHINGGAAVGDVIEGVTSGTLATVVGIYWPSGTNDWGTLSFADPDGSFSNGEQVRVSFSEKTISTSSPVLLGETDSQRHAQYKNEAADLRRAFRDAVGNSAGTSSSGGVDGFMRLGDSKFAIRNNSGGTAADLWEAGSPGSGYWTQVPLGYEMSFTSGGTYEVLVGDTITGQTSTETAEITGVVLESGTWAGGDAVGRLIYLTSSGAFTSTELLDVGANADVATCTADGTAITLSASGSYEYLRHNFGGQAGTKKIYAANGVDRGFEFDGTTLIPIATGMDTDTPTHVFVFKKHLFFSFGSSAQHSGIGTPYIWSIVSGAAELSVGDTINAFHEQPGSEGGGSLAIFSDNTIHVLYGSSTADWNLVYYRKEVGAYASSVQQVGSRMLYADSRAILDLETTQKFGNFNHSALSTLVQSWYLARQDKIVASCISRDKNQYRLFFSDSYALYVTMDGSKVAGMMPILLSHDVTCIDSSEAVDGTEEIYFGSSDGYVYQMEKGTSFNGESIETWLKLHFHHSGAPRVKKRYHGGASIEVEGTGYSEFDFSYELGYGSDEIAQPSTQTKTFSFSAGRAPAGAPIDDLTIIPAVVDMRGSAENVGLTIESNSDYFESIKLSGALLRTSMRRRQR